MIDNGRLERAAHCRYAMSYVCRVQVLSESQKLNHIAKCEGVRYGKEFG